jgi:hypothetical protein
MTIVDHIFSSGWYVLAALLAIGAVCSTVFRIVNRFLRHLNISMHGWPPSHIDADGDWKPETKKED